MLQKMLLAENVKTLVFDTQGLNKLIFRNAQRQESSVFSGVLNFRNAQFYSGARSATLVMRAINVTHLMHGW